MTKSFDRFASVAFLAIGTAFVVESRNISDSAYGSNVGPSLFPMGLGILLVLLSIRLFVETFRYQESNKRGDSLDWKRFIIILVSATLYGLLLEEIGYIITTFLFLLIGFQTMEKGKWISSLLVSGLFSGGVYYVYVDILQGTLPGWPVWLS